MTSHLNRAANYCAIAAAAVLLTSGCGATPPTQAARGTSDEPTITRPARLLDSVNLHLPVQNFMLSESQLNTVARARVVLVIRCLGRYGIHVSEPTAPDRSDMYGPRSMMDRRYGITDAALAAKYGFGLGARDPSRQTKPRQPDLGPAGRTVLTGQGRSSVNGLRVPDGGCLGEADRSLDVGKPDGADPGLPQRLQFQSFEESKHDSRVRQVFTAWSACMASMGYQYANPLASVADPAFTGSGQATAEEIKVAQADLTCKKQTNLVGVWFTVESAYQRQAISSDANAFQLAKTALDRRAATAAATVQGH